VQRQLRAAVRWEIDRHELIAGGQWCVAAGEPTMKCPSSLNVLKDTSP
jgi:hypothetical protein